MWTHYNCNCILVLATPMATRVDETCLRLLCNKIIIITYIEVHFVGLFKNVIHLIKAQHMEHTKQTKFFVQHLADQYLAEWKSLLNNVDNNLERSASAPHCHSLLVAGCMLRSVSLAHKYKFGRMTFRTLCTTSIFNVFKCSCTRSL